MNSGEGAPYAATERVETVIIGAGQAGLAIGYHLTKGGRPFVILEANERIGASWRNRWSSLRLFTQTRYSGLPGMPFPAPRWSYPTKDEVADYCRHMRRASPCRCGPGSGWTGWRGRRTTGC